MTQPWFEPKRYGYGARPCSWQGWAMTCACGPVVALIVVSLPDPWRWLLVLPIVSAYVAVARAKSSAPWKWRWGGE